MKRAGFNGTLSAAALLLASLASWLGKQESADTFALISVVTALWAIADKVGGADRG